MMIFKSWFFKKYAIKNKKNNCLNYRIWINKKIFFFKYLIYYKFLLCKCQSITLLFQIIIYLNESETSLKTYIFWAKYNYLILLIILKFFITSQKIIFVNSFSVLFILINFIYLKFFYTKLINFFNLKSFYFIKFT
jgi:hypothetical protein